MSEERYPGDTIVVELNQRAMRFRDTKGHLVRVVFTDRGNKAEDLFRLRMVIAIAQSACHDEDESTAWNGANATVGVRILAVGLAETGCVSFPALYGVDEVCLPHVSRDQSESLGFFSQVRHFHVVISLGGGAFQSLECCWQPVCTSGTAPVKAVNERCLCSHLWKWFAMCLRTGHVHTRTWPNAIA
jgi:hypothetical protein